MGRFHNGPNGPGDCNANNGKCPYGGESGNDNHFDTKKEAEASYAKAQGGNPPPPLKKPKFHNRPKNFKDNPNPETKTYATKEEALRAFTNHQKNSSDNTETQKKLSELINRDELSQSEDGGGINGMSDEFIDSIQSNPELRNELNKMVESTGLDPKEYHVAAIMPRDSLDGGALYNMINFQAQENYDDYDWDAHDDGEEEDIEQTKKYYNKFLEDDESNLENPMVEAEYNGATYTIFASSNREDRAAIYGDESN